MLTSLVLACLVTEDLSKMRNFGKRFAESVEQIVYTILDQELFSRHLRTQASRILWFFVCESLYVVVIGYFCNYMSTDMVAEVKPSLIDSLQDQMSPEFEHVTPTMLESYSAFTFVQNVKPESLVGRFYRRLLSNRKESLITENSGLQIESIIERLRKGMAEQRMSLAISTDVYDAIGEHILCHLDPSIVINTHRSQSGTFGGGIITSMMSKEIDSQLRSFIEYRFMTMFEIGIVYQEQRISRSETINMFETTYETIKCLAHVTNDNGLHFEALQLLGILRTIHISLYCVVFAIFLVVVELIAKRVLRRNRKLFRRRSKRIQRIPGLRGVVNLFRTNRLNR